MTSAIEEWARAETSLGQKADEARAAVLLPARLKWIFLAMAALEHGECQAIEAVAEQAFAAGAVDVAWILRLLLAEPGALDPSTVRKQAKRDGAGGQAQLPVLDLLRLMTSWREQGGGMSTPSLTAAARERPMLRWVMAQLRRQGWQPPLSRYRRRERDDAAPLRALSPRVVPLWIACDAKQQGYAAPREALRHYLPRSAVSFPADRWPDLDEPQARRPSIDGFLAEPLATAWTDALEDSLDALNDGPADRRRAALRALLVRIDHDLREAPRPLRALPMIRTATGLAKRTSGLDLLALLLVTLDTRLSWFTPGEPGSIEMLEALWSRLKDRPAAERRVVATFAHGPGADELPTSLWRETALCLLATATGRRERETWIERFAAELPQGSVERALAERADHQTGTARGAGADIGEAERRYLLGVCDVHGRRARAAIETAAALLENPPEVEYGVRLLVAALASDRRTLRGTGGAKAIQRAVEACARASLRRCDAATLLPALRNAVDPPRYDALRALIRPAAMAPLVRVDGGDGARERLLDPDLAFDLLGWELLGEGETAAGLFRALGRHLRGEASAGGGRDAAVNGDGLALRIVIRLLAHGGLAIESGQPRRWIDALNAYLVRNGPAALMAHAMRIDIPALFESRDGFGLAAWLLSCKPVHGEREAWLEIARRLGQAVEKRWADGAKRFIRETSLLLPQAPARPILKRFLVSIMAESRLGGMPEMDELARRAGISRTDLMGLLVRDALFEHEDSDDDGLDGGVFDDELDDELDEDELDGIDDLDDALDDSEDDGRR